MNTLIVYATKYGCTETCAQTLSKKLTGKVELCNLKTGKVPDLSQYDKVIIGSSVYIGQIRKEAKAFCSNHLNVLKEKKLGLFICAMQAEDVIQTELKTSFPQELSDVAIVKECFGGEFILKRMNVLDRFITKKIAKTENDTSKISEESINKFAEQMNKA